MKFIGAHIFDYDATFRGDVTIEGNLTISNSVSQIISFGDNDRLKFGDSNDLEIYHDGSNSFINETGTGSLIQQASAHFIRQGGTNNTNNAIMLLSGSVSLFHNNVSKLETTSTGIDVDGNIRFVNTGDYLKFANDFVAVKRVSNFLRLDGFAGFIFNETNGAGELMRLNSTGLGIGTNSPNMPLSIESSDDFLAFFKSTDNKGFIGIADNDTTGYVSAENDTMSFGAATGVNANNLNINLSNNNVGIGTSSPNRQFQVKRTTGTASIAITSSNTGLAQLELGGTSDNDIAGVTYNGATSTLSLKTNNTGQLYVNNDGKVGINQSSPVYTLDVGGNVGIRGGGQTTNQLFLNNGNVLISGDTSNQLFLKANDTGYIGLYTGGSERVRILNNGRVGIGTQTANAALDIQGSAADLRLTSTGQNRTALANTSTGFEISQIGNKAIYFLTNGTEKARISGDGKVGIGTNSPDAILHIKDVNPRIIKLEDANYTDQYATIGFDDGHIKLSSDPDNQRADSIISFSIDNSLKMLLSSDGDLALGLTSASKRLHVFDTTSGIARFQTDQTFTDIELKTNNGTALVSARDGNVLLNRTGGNVGIATEPGAAYKLDVNGKVKARGVLELDDVLTLNAISTPPDPGTNQSSIYMDSADGAIRVKINVGGTVVTRTLATFE